MAVFATAYIDITKDEDQQIVINSIWNNIKVY